MFFPLGTSASFPKDTQDRLTGDFNLLVDLNVSVSGCLSVYVSPVMNWQLVQAMYHPAQSQLGLASAPL